LIIKNVKLQKKKIKERNQTDKDGNFVKKTNIFELWVDLPRYEMVSEVKNGRVDIWVPDDCCSNGKIDREKIKKKYKEGWFKRGPPDVD